jgi:hypothetical protein
VADTVKITLAAHHAGKLPGDSIEVDGREAKRLVGAGIAVPATKPAAKALGVDPESAATAKD